MTPYDVTMYCPDQHLVYDGLTPDRQGVGGGVTVRIRLARALSLLGHRVTMLVNCPRGAAFGAVRYVPWKEARSISADVLVLTTSGGALDLRPILDVEVKARLRVVWAHGVGAPRGLHDVGLDFLCTPSNFIRRVALSKWGIAADTAFVAYNAADAHPPRRFFRWRRPRRDFYRLVYASHPAKGLDAAIEVLRILRRSEPRFQLHVYGGPRLWGEPDGMIPSEPGLVYHGLTGQGRLADELSRAGISLNLQSLEEAFGLTVLEAMRAGCVVLASPVGAYQEIVRHGQNGFLVPGDHREEATWRRAADVVTHLARSPEHVRYVTHNAMAVPWDWETMASTWSGHWNWALGRERDRDNSLALLGLACRECGSGYLALADGYHCTGCGFYGEGP